MIKRHPVLYYIRYFLLSQNISKKVSVDDVGCFNNINDVKDVPQLFFEVNHEMRLTGADEFEKAQEIAVFLRSRTPVGPAQSKSSGRTLEGMLYGKGGVCSDFSQVFNIFCLINNIRVKEWNCVDTLYGARFGHTFNEIYSSALQKWVAIDTHKGFYFTGDDDTPLSAIETFTRLRQVKKVDFVYFSEYRPPKPERLPMVYSASTIPFIISNYRISVNDQYLSKFEKMPSLVSSLAMIFTGKNHRFTFVLDDYRKKMLPFLFKRN